MGYYAHLPYFYVIFCCSLILLIDLVPISQIVKYYYVYSSMKYLKLMMISSGQKLDFICKRYKIIADTLSKIRKIKPLSDSLVSSNNFLAILTYAYLPLHKISSKKLRRRVTTLVGRYIMYLAWHFILTVFNVLVSLYFFFEYRT